MCYGTEWTKKFNCCSRNWIKIGFCTSQSVTAPTDVKAKIIRAEDDLDTVDADEDAEYEAFIKELYSPSD